MKKLYIISIDPHIISPHETGSQKRMAFSPEEIKKTMKFKFFFWGK